MGPSRSVCIPSVRPLASSRTTFRSAERYASDRGDTEIIVADNSGDEEKLKFLDKRENFVSIQTTGLSESLNWNAAFDKSSGEWVSFLSDDDFLFCLGPEGDAGQIDSAVIGIVPCIAIWNESRGVYDHRNISIAGLTAKDRVSQYGRLARGNNNALFGFFRRQARVLVQDHVLMHPTRMQGYNDWAITFMFLAEGNFINDPASLLVYNNQNWCGNSEEIQKKIDRLFVNVGFKATDSRQLHLLLGLDCFIGIMRANSSLGTREKFDAAMWCLMEYLKSHICAMRQNPSAYTQAEQNLWLGQNLRFSFKELFDALSESVVLISPALEHDYRQFHKAAIEADWGCADTLSGL